MYQAVPKRYHGVTDSHPGPDSFPATTRGSDEPPPTHAWFIARARDLAVAVLVEDRPSGAEFAAPIVERFFSRVGG